MGDIIFNLRVLRHIETFRDCRLPRAVVLGTSFTSTRLPTRLPRAADHLRAE